MFFHVGKIIYIKETIWAGDVRKWGTEKHIWD